MTNFNLGKWGYHRQGYCQAGLGAAIDKVSFQQLFSVFPNGLCWWTFQISKLYTMNDAISWKYFEKDVKIFCFRLEINYSSELLDRGIGKVKYSF